MTTILVVEDDRLFRWAVKEALSDAGFDVLEARTGIEAKRCAADEVDLAIMDYHLPGANGFGLARELREANVTFPIVILTAHATEEEAAHATLLGACHYASKPDDPREVVRLVNRLLQSERDNPQAGEVFQA